MILAIHPNHAEAILSGKKVHELRLRVPNLSAGTVVYLYVTSPIMSILGGFKVAGIIEDQPDRLWDTVGKTLDISLSEFRAYTRRHARAKAIAIAEAFRLKRPASRSELSAIVPGYKPPQSMSYLRHDALRRHLALLRRPSG